MTSKKIKTWLNGINAKPGTRKIYESAVNDFAEFVGKTPDEIISSYLQDIKDAKLMPERQVFEDLPNFSGELKEKRQLAPKTINLKVSAVKSFLRHFYIDIPNIKIAKRKVLPGNANRFLTREQICHVLEYAGQIRNRAIVTVMASSGMASNEIRNLKIGQIEFDDNQIGTVTLRREKAEHDYFTFIGPESTAILKEYWEQRERKGKRQLTDDDFVFTKSKKERENDKMSERAFLFLFSDMNLRAGYQKGQNKKQAEIRSHALRKFFSSALESNGMSQKRVNWLLGHTPDVTDSAYFFKSVDELKRDYIDHLPFLTFQDEIVIRSLDTEDAIRLNELEKENKEMKEKMENIDTMMDQKIAEILKERFEK